MRVIIVGAGAAGLMAANLLAKSGAEVVVLETAPRIGGRIHTFVPDGFTHQVEAGAEFIHGRLPLTLGLMKRAKQPLVEASGKMYVARNGEMGSRFGTGGKWNVFYDALVDIKKDCTLEEFLSAHFSGRPFDRLRKDVRDMAQGLDLADPARLSVMSIRDEWLSDETQYRPLNGYRPMVEFLRDDAAGGNLRIFLEHDVTEIIWETGRVQVLTNRGNFMAEHVILTAALAAYQNQQIRFSPAMDLPFAEIGFGEVIKLALEFDTAFWERYREDIGFLFTDGGITFWTQRAMQKPFLTGWIGNGYVQVYKDMSDEALLELALAKLREAFSATDIKRQYARGAVFRYTRETPTGGGYAWLTPQSKTAVKKINKGVFDTVWFAGEAFDPVGAVGTVEAALRSAKHVVAKMRRATLQQKK
jgi:monoamine oxidase